MLTPFSPRRFTQVVVAGVLMGAFDSWLHDVPPITSAPTGGEIGAALFGLERFLL